MEIAFVAAVAQPTLIYYYWNQLNIHYILSSIFKGL